MASGVCVLLRIQKGLLEINTNSPMVSCRTFPFFSFTGISGSENLFFFFLIHLFFWLRWVFIAVCSLSLVVASGGYSLVMVLGLLVVVASFVSVHGFSCPSVWGIFRDQRDQNHVPHIGRRILNHCNTPRSPSFFFFLDIVQIF